MDNEIQYMATHPPRCLGSRVTEASEQLAAKLRDSLGDNSTSFALVCDCSNTELRIKVPECFGVISISCPKCNMERPIFHPLQHGYDGELQHNEGMELEPSSAFKCPDCQSDVLQVAIGFQYSGETDVLEEEDPPDVKPENLFGWLAVVCQCQSCKAIHPITDVECA